MGGVSGFICNIFLTRMLSEEIYRLYIFLLPLRNIKFYYYEISHTNRYGGIPVETLVKYFHSNNTEDSGSFKRDTGDYINILH